MKKNLIIIGICIVYLLSSGANLKAQKKIDNSIFECIYSYNQNKEQSSNKYFTMLEIGSKTAKFEDYAHYQLDSVIAAKANKEEIDKYKKQVEKSAFYFEPTIIQNFPTGKISVFDVIIPDYYTYNENSKKDWKIFYKEKKKICGYDCYKATTEYGGKKWTAWFALKIQAPFGPWKLSGLPGLILKASDDKNQHVFEAISIRKNDRDICSLAKKQRIKSSRDKFVKRKNVVYANPMKNIPVESISSMTVKRLENNTKIAYINGLRLRMNHGAYLPIEK